MNLAKKIMVNLPDRTQDALMERLMKRGRTFVTPVWEMLCRTLGFMGADIAFLNRELAVDSVEKVTLPNQNGAICGYLHLPQGEGQFPALVSCQCNEDFKEFLTRFADLAVEQGLAVFNCEPTPVGTSTRNQEGE